MSSIVCRQCNQPITFDNKHISQRTGKKIPLNIDTQEPHNCPARNSQSQQQKLATNFSQQDQQQQHGQHMRYLQCNRAAAAKSTLMQTARPAQGNGFH